MIKLIKEAVILTCTFVIAVMATVFISRVIFPLPGVPAKISELVGSYFLVEDGPNWYLPAYEEVEQPCVVDQWFGSDDDGSRVFFFYAIPNCTMTVRARTVWLLGKRRILGGMDFVKHQTRRVESVTVDGQVLERWVGKSATEKFFNSDCKTTPYPHPLCIPELPPGGTIKLNQTALRESSWLWWLASKQ